MSKVNARKRAEGKTADGSNPMVSDAEQEGGRIDVPHIARSSRRIVWGAWLLVAGVPLTLAAVGIVLGALGAVLMLSGYWSCRRASTWGLLSYLLLVNILPIGPALYLLKGEDWMPLVMAWFPLSALAGTFPYLKFIRRVSAKLGVATPSAKFYAIACAVVLAFAAVHYVRFFTNRASQSDSSGEHAGVVLGASIMLACLPLLLWFIYLASRFRSALIAATATPPIAQP
jgi:hypothetical protein